MSPLEQLCRIMSHADKRDPDYIIVGLGINVPKGKELPRWRTYQTAAQRILDAGFERKQDDVIQAEARVHEDEGEVHLQINFRGFPSVSAAQDLALKVKAFTKNLIKEMFDDNTLPS